MHKTEILVRVSHVGMKVLGGKELGAVCLHIPSTSHNILQKVSGSDESDVEKSERHSGQVVGTSAVTSPCFLGSGLPVCYQCPGTMSTWQEIHHISESTREHFTINSLDR